MRYGGGGGTLVSPVAAIVVLAAIGAIFCLPRRQVVMPLLVASFFMPLSQQVVIGGLHFMMFRILVAAAWLRLIVSGAVIGSGPNRFRFTGLDKAVILFAITSAITFVVLWGEWGAVIDRLGFLYNVVGLYFLFRLLVRDQQTVLLTIRGLAVVCVILAVCMINERITGRNLFAVFGGVPELTYVREGKLRAQGAFAHPILAGTFGATTIPLFVALWASRKFRTTAAVAMAGAAGVTICSASSTPLMAFMAGISALCLWPLRRNMRLIRWAAVGMLVTLHMIMKAPVWALINRVDLVGGSSSSHRYELIDRSIQHFGQWWLVGTQNVNSWGFEMGDTSNQYIDIGVTGGIFALALFLAVVAIAFRKIGTVRKACSGNRSVEISVWALGAALFANVVAFVGISYFDQIIVGWYALLAIIANCQVFVPVKASVEKPKQPSPSPFWTLKTERAVQST